VEIVYKKLAAVKKEKSTQDMNPAPSILER
jgi:hypothetical protein